MIYFLNNRIQYTREIQMTTDTIHNNRLNHSSTPINKTCLSQYYLTDILSSHWRKQQGKTKINKRTYTQNQYVASKIVRQRPTTNYGELLLRIIFEWMHLHNQMLPSQRKGYMQLLQMTCFVLFELGFCSWNSFCFVVRNMWCYIK